MDFYEKTIRDIKSVKIQGATNVAKYAIKALRWKSTKIKARTPHEFISKLEICKRELLDTRATEPLMRNSLRYILGYLKKSEARDIKDLAKLIDVASTEFLFNLKKSKEKIAEIGANMIKNNSTIFTHCHSSTVIDILQKAKKKGKKFEVIHTESRPLYQGHRTAKALTKMKVPATMIVDSAVSTYIRKADMAMVGADLITAESSLLNKVGTLNLALGCKRLNIPFFCATVLAKFDPETVFGKAEEIEMRDGKEIWDNPPKGLRIENPAFDVTSRELINAYITEEGIITPESISESVLLKAGWMLR